MRTTVDLPDDLHKLAQSIARDTHRSFSATIVDLIRRGLDAGRSEGPSTSSVTGLPVLTLGRVITSEDVRALDDEQ